MKNYCGIGFPSDRDLYFCCCFLCKKLFDKNLGLGSLHTLIFLFNTLPVCSSGQSPSLSVEKEIIGVVDSYLREEVGSLWYEDAGIDTVCASRRAWLYGMWHNISHSLEFSTLQEHVLLWIFFCVF